jgi:ABC-2 type transport system permease protein
MKAYRAQARIELTLTLRRGESVLVAIAIPAGMLAFFATVAVLPSAGRHPVDFLVPGTVAIAVMATAMVSLGIATGFERFYGVLKRLGATPLGRPALLAAKATSVGVIEVIQVAVLVVLGALLGWKGPVNVVALVISLILGTAAFAGIGLAMAGSLRAEANLAASNGLFILLILLGGSVIPIGRLPHALQIVSRALPAFPLSETMRWALAGAPRPGGALLALAAWAVTAPTIAALTFSWE